MAAKHIEIAKAQGAKEGFKMWKKNLKRSGIPQVQDRYAELLSQGDVQAQFRYYCAQYGDKIGLTTGRASQGRTTTPATTETPANATDLFAQFQAFIASQAGNATADADLDDDLDEEYDEDAELDDIEEPLTTATQGTGTSRATRRAAAPNADPFAPREPNAHATNGRLWKLNELGLLRVTKKAGDSITNGEAHAILKALL